MKSQRDKAENQVLERQHTETILHAASIAKENNRKIINLATSDCSDFV